MKKITFSSNDTSQLSKFAVSGDVTNSESELYRFTMVDGARQRKDYLFKKLYISFTFSIAFDIFANS